MIYEKRKINNPMYNNLLFKNINRNIDINVLKNYNKLFKISKILLSSKIFTSFLTVLFLIISFYSSYILLQNILEFYSFYLNIKYYSKYENINKNSFCNFYCE